MTQCYDYMRDELFKESALTQLPDYMAPFDNGHPIPSYEEQLKATLTIRTVIDDKILQCMGSLEAVSKHEDMFVILRLDGFDNVGNPIKLRIECFDETDEPGALQYELTVVEGFSEDHKKFIRGHSYGVPNLYGEEGVTRHDFTIKDLPQLPIPDELRADTSAEGIRELSDILTMLARDIDTIEQSRLLEKQMGINNLPVSLEEMEVIASFLAAAEPTLREDS